MPVASVPDTTLPMEIHYTQKEKGLRPQKRKKGHTVLKNARKYESFLQVEE